MAVETLPIARNIVRHARRSLLSWGVAMAAITAMYVSLYPSIADFDFDAYLEALPEGMGTALGYDQISTAAGFINSTVYALLAPIVLAVFAIGLGGRLVGGFEEEGVLELELTAPVPRSQVYLERLGALWLQITLLVLVVWAVTSAIVAGIDLDLKAANLLAGTIGLWLFLGTFGTLALAIGAASGRRGVAVAVAAGLAVAAYAFNALGNMVEAEWMVGVSPFGWYIADEPLTNGFDGGGLALLALLAIVAGLAGLRRFTTRDLMV